MEAFATLQDEMTSIIAEGRIFTALTRDILPAADLMYKIGEEGLVSPENEENGSEH